MKNRAVCSLAGAVLLALCASGEEKTSEPTFIFLRPETSSFWNTATNSTMDVPIDYPYGATKATLSVSGPGYGVHTYTNLTADSFTLNLPSPDSPEAENVYDLVLTFDDGTVQKARLGLVQGLLPDAEGMTRCLAPEGSPAWGVVRRRAVMPIPYGAESLTMSINGAAPVAVDTGLDGAQGWYALKPAIGASVTLSLSADGENYVAALLGLGNGFTIMVK